MTSVIFLILKAMLLVRTRNDGYADSEMKGSTEFPLIFIQENLLLFLLQKIRRTMKKTVSETRKYRTDMNDKILNSGFRDFNKFFALDNKAYIDGALPAKMKELMGLVGSMVLRCNDCIFYHIDRSIQEGATRQEMYEAFNIALIIGGSIVIPHLRYAMEILDDLLNEKTEKE